MAYIAKTKILHNDQSYKAGDTIPDLKEDEAKRLLELGATETVGKKARSSAQTPSE